MPCSKKDIGLHVALPLIIGTAFYFFRSYPPIFVPTIYRWHPQEWWQKLLLYSGPDFCWAYSLTFAMLCWAMSNSISINVTAFAALAIIVLSEYLQVGSGRFTFDYVDLAAAICAVLLSTIFIKKRHEKN